MTVIGCQGYGRTAAGKIAPDVMYQVFGRAGDCVRGGKHLNGSLMYRAGGMDCGCPLSHVYSLAYSIVSWVVLFSIARHRLNASSRAARIVGYVPGISTIADKPKRRAARQGSRDKTIFTRNVSSGPLVIEIRGRFSIGKRGRGVGFPPARVQVIRSRSMQTAFRCTS